MQRNILVDLNVILDVLLERRGYLDAQRVLSLGENQDCQLYISAHMVTTFAYLLESVKVPAQQIVFQLNWLLETFNVVSVDGRILKQALKSHIKDYEDAVVEQAAVSCKANAIITRNVKDFEMSTVRAMAPDVYLQSN